MAYGLQVFDSNGSALIDSSKSTAFYLNSGSFSSGNDQTLPNLPSYSTTGYIFWPTNGHVITDISTNWTSPDVYMDYAAPGYTTPFTFMGPWKHHPMVNASGGVDLKYPNIRLWNSYIGNYEYTHARVNSGLATVEYDTWVN